MSPVNRALSIRDGRSDLRRSHFRELSLKRSTNEMPRSVRRTALAASCAVAAAYSPSPATRRDALRAAAGGLAAVSFSSPAFAEQSWAQSVGLAAPDRSGLQSKFLEKARVFLQDSADEIQYGGQEGLAPGGPPSALPAVQLIPIVRMQQVLTELSPNLDDVSKWDAVLLTIERAPFETLALKKIFNAYADNIYYVSGSAEANAYLLGGATPSNKQTTQYLLRNEILKQLGELRDEIKYQQSIASGKCTLGACQPETEVAREYMDKTLKAFKDYLALAEADERALAFESVYGEAAAKQMLAVK